MSTLRFAERCRLGAAGRDDSGKAALDTGGHKRLLLSVQHSLNALAGPLLRSCPAHGCCVPNEVVLR
jgi:hypothetical protein